MSSPTRWKPLRICSVRCRHAIILIDHALLHDKEDVFGLPHILHRIARHRHYIREFACFQPSDFVGYSGQIGARGSSRLQRVNWFQEGQSTSATFVSLWISPISAERYTRTLTIAGLQKKSRSSSPQFESDPSSSSIKPARKNRERERAETAGRARSGFERKNSRAR